MFHGAEIECRVKSLAYGSSCPSGFWRVSKVSVEDIVAMLMEYAKAHPP